MAKATPKIVIDEMNYLEKFGVFEFHIEDVDMTLTIAGQRICMQLLNNKINLFGKYALEQN